VIKIVNEGGAGPVAITISKTITADVVVGSGIAGLFAAGNVSGSFFGGNIYPTTTPGLTHSRAWTFGRLAGLHATAKRTLSINLCM
jgi:succinate dehydrogenase/fumarate reductase flavoprotein subunit